MSKRKQRRRCRKSKGVWGMIDRVVHGLSEALGLGHGMIITGFVLGFIFVPLLTAIVFLADALLGVLSRAGETSSGTCLGRRTARGSPPE